MPDNRDKTGRFKPGRSGNPGGRPKMPDEVKDMLKAATPKAAALLVEMIEDKAAPANLRLDAAKTVLDRVYGKAAQPIDGSMDAVLEIVVGDGLRELME